MIGPLSLVFAALSASAVEYTRRGAVNEVRGRVGLGVERKEQLTVDKMVDRELVQADRLLSSDEERRQFRQTFRAMTDHLYESEILGLAPWFAREIRKNLKAFASFRALDNNPDPALRGIPGMFMPLHDVSRQMTDWWNEEQPDILRYTWEQALVASYEWHRQLAADTPLGGKALAGVPVLRFEDGWTLERLVTRRQLESEGQSMGHCVGGYWQKVREASCVIFSLREGDGSPVATIEAQKTEGLWKMRQVQGRQNQRIRDPAIALHLHLAFQALGLRGSAGAETRLVYQLAQAEDFIVTTSDILAVIRGSTPISLPLLHMKTAMEQTRKAVAVYREACHLAVDFRELREWLEEQLKSIYPVFVKKIPGAEFDRVSREATERLLELVTRYKRFGDQVLLPWTIFRGWPERVRILENSLSGRAVLQWMGEAWQLIDHYRGEYYYAVVHAMTSEVECFAGAQKEGRGIGWEDPIMLAVTNRHDSVELMRYDPYFGGVGRVWILNPGHYNPLEDADIQLVATIRTREQEDHGRADSVLETLDAAGVFKTTVEVQERLDRLHMAIVEHPIGPGKAFAPTGEILEAAQAAGLYLSRDALALLRRR